MPTKRITSRSARPRLRARNTARPYRRVRQYHHVGIITGGALAYAALEATNTPNSINLINSLQTQNWGALTNPENYINGVKSEWQQIALGLGTAVVSSYVGHTSWGRKLSYKTKKWRISLF